MNTLLKQGNDRGALLHQRKHDVSQPMGLSRATNYTRQKDIFSDFVQAARARLRYFPGSSFADSLFLRAAQKSNDGVAGTLDTLCDCL